MALAITATIASPGASSGVGTSSRCRLLAARTWSPAWIVGAIDADGIRVARRAGARRASRAGPPAGRRSAARCGAGAWVGVTSGGGPRRHGGVARARAPDAEGPPIAPSRATVSRPASAARARGTDVSATRRDGTRRRGVPPVEPSGSRPTGELVHPQQHAEQQHDVDGDPAGHAHRGWPAAGR